MRLQFTGQFDTSTEMIARAMILPFDVGTVDGRPYRFAEGCLVPAKKILLLKDHTPTVESVCGYVSLVDGGEGGQLADLVFDETAADVFHKVANGIVDGVSVGVEIAGASYNVDEDGAITFTSGVYLREVSLVVFPAFDEARVLLSAHDKEQFMDLDTPAPLPASPSSPVTTRPRQQHGVDSPHRFIRDLMDAQRRGDAEASQRVAATMAGVASGELVLSVTRGGLDFAPSTTSGHPALVPDQNRPDLLQVPPLNPTPLRDAAFVNGIPNGLSSWIVPRVVSGTGLYGDHVEGTNPSYGTITTENFTITTASASGAVDLTRELVDSATPDVEAQIMSMLLDAKAQYVEGKLLATLDAIAAADTGEGAVVEVEGTAGDLIKAVRIRQVRAALRPGANLTSGLISADVIEVLLAAEDSSGRPLIDAEGSAVNAEGTADASAAKVSIRRFPLQAAALLSTNNYLVSKPDFRLWESPLSTFRFEEVAGPAKIRLAGHGYYASAVLRDASVVRFTYTEA